MHDLMDPRHGTVELANPISSDMSVMRTSLWPGLLQTVGYNQSRQQGRIRIFESGLRFIQDEAQIRQEMMLSGAVTGSVEPEQWGLPSRPVDFFDLKQDLMAVLSLTGNPASFAFVAAEHPALHPGQTARIERNGQALGWIGMLHPEIQHKLDLNENVYLFELRLDEALEGCLPEFRPLSKYPSIRRDIAIVLDRAVPFATVSDCIRKAAPEILQDILLFDVYTGEKVDSGLKSLALGLILQGSSHTLTDSEVEEAVTVVLQALKNNLDAQLRD
jgi:phenylalanyl-tRNA synthetase beta chain